ncbi:hypothetical protein BJ741DRAFT_646816 [Chytriomyces cf. hyalinus JEL632]|nr:hypothetical protein BJ741DRAFT_646816 [Chytriomyces cf. hyalinus JEL632]
MAQVCLTSRDYGTPETVVKIIGPYILGDQIGKGAYGKVNEGLCSQTLQRVAIKIINKKRLRKIPNGVENALSEIKLLKQMKNRNVITLIDVYCKVEDGEGNIGIFNWFSSIEDSPITWTMLLTVLEREATPCPAGSNGGGDSSSSLSPKLIFVTCGSDFRLRVRDSTRTKIVGQPSCSFLTETNRCLREGEMGCGEDGGCGTCRTKHVASPSAGTSGLNTLEEVFFSCVIKVSMVWWREP